MLSNLGEWSNQLHKGLCSAPDDAKRNTVRAMRHPRMITAAGWLLVAQLTLGTMALNCIPGWPSETDNYNPPKGKNGTHVARNPLSMLRISEQTVVRAMFSVPLSITKTAQERIETTDSIEQDMHMIERRADLGNCCRPTWECFHLFHEGDVVREGTEKWDQGQCCKLRYTQCCRDPQEANGELWWLEPPGCSNKDIVGKNADKGYTLSASRIPVTLSLGFGA